MMQIRSCSDGIAGPISIAELAEAVPTAAPRSDDFQDPL